LNANRASYIRQIKILIAETLVPDPSPLEAEVALAGLKEYRSLGSDQISAELIQA
jgi:hypothetical protein